MDNDSFPTLKTFFLIVWRHIRGFFVVLLLMSSLGGAITVLLWSKTPYESTCYLRITNSSTVEAQVLVDETATSQETASAVFTYCAENKIVHNDGSSISVTEIKNGVGYFYSATSASARNLISFSSLDKTICKPVLEGIINKTIEIAQGKSSLEALKTLQKDGEVSDPSRSESTSKKTFLAFVAGGFICALAYGLISEKYNDRILSFSDSSVGGEPVILVCYDGEENKNETKK